VNCHPYQDDGAGRPTQASRSIGEWLSLVEHLVRDQGVGGSNPLSPTILSICFNQYKQGILGWKHQEILGWKPSRRFRLNRSGCASATRQG